MKKVCKVLFRNIRPRAVRLNDQRGNQIYSLRPGEVKEFEIVNEGSLYFGYAELLFKEGGIEYSFQEGFEPPEPGLMILNLDGAEFEWRRVAGAEGEILCQRNLPRWVKLNENPKGYKRLIIKRVIEPQRSEKFKGFYQFEETLKDIFEH